MQEWDFGIVRAINAFSGRWPLFDQIVLEIFRMPSFKMLPLVSLLVWLWFSRSEWSVRRQGVLAGLFGGLTTLIVTRLIQNLGPHRPRPALDGRFEFHLPVGGYTNDWSSFPSDTAGLAFAIATGVFLAHRRLGLAAFGWAALPVSFPRLYGGFHYPSDLLAGAAIGIACTLAVFNSRPLQAGIRAGLNALPDHARPWIYVIAFILCFQTSTYFADVRSAGQKALNVFNIK